MWAHMADPGYERCAKNLFQDMKDLHKIGIEGMVSCQIQRTFFPTALPFNMMAAALWDENCDFEEKRIMVSLGLMATFLLDIFTNL